MLEKDKDHLISRAILLQLILGTWCHLSKRAGNFSMIYLTRLSQDLSPARTTDKEETALVEGRHNAQWQVRITCDKFLNICFRLVTEQNISLCYF